MNTKVPLFVDSRSIFSDNSLHFSIYSRTTSIPPTLPRVTGSSAPDQRNNQAAPPEARPPPHPGPERIVTQSLTILLQPPLLLQRRARPPQKLLQLLRQLHQPPLLRHQLHAGLRDHRRQKWLRLPPAHPPHLLRLPQGNRPKLFANAQQRQRRSNHSSSLTHRKTSTRSSTSVTSS